MGSTELLIRIELILGAKTSKCPIIEHANGLAELSHPVQSRFLSDLEFVRDLSHSHACQLLSVSSDALTSLDQEQYDSWLQTIKKSLVAGEDQAAASAIENYSDIVDDKCTVKLYRIVNTLEKLVSGIVNRDLAILPCDDVVGGDGYTDGLRLFLPPAISRFDTYDDNFRLYRILTFHLIGQIQAQSYLAADALSRKTDRYGPVFLEVFSTLETLRIDRVIQRDYPGVWRQIEALNRECGIDYPVELFTDSEIGSYQDSLDLAEQLVGENRRLPELPYRPQFIPAMMDESRLNAKAGKALPVAPPNEPDNAPQKPEKRSGSESSQSLFASDTPDSGVNEGSDYDQIPQPGNDDSDIPTEQSDLPAPRETGIFYYPEWDKSLQKFRSDWCHVEEIEAEAIESGDAAPRSQGLRNAEQRIKKAFDMLVNEQRFMRFQREGDEIDIDSWVSARCASQTQGDDMQNLYIRNNKNTRNVAIMFAVDISGSTAGWKNRVIRDSTAIMCNTLARLNDQYAVYAFSGNGRRQCRAYPLKRFDESNNKVVQARIASIRPQQYTRMGAAIRHMSYVLSKASATTRILLVLTDGRPDDIDSYRGHYAVEDTRRALYEARAQGLKPFVLTFDREGLDYLPYMTGPNRYQLISDISQLPLQLSNIYQHLTR